MIQPPSRPARLGLPWHGLHLGEHFAFEGYAAPSQLGFYTAGQRQHYAPAIDGCRSRLLRHPTRAQTITPSAAESAAGIAWRDYLLVCGRNMAIGNTALGDGHWLYVDDAGSVWLMRLNPVPSQTIANRITLQVIVRGLFGVFTPDNRHHGLIDRLIAEIDIDIVTGPYVTETGDYDDEIDNTLTFAAGVSRHLEFNTRGADCILSVLHPQLYGKNTPSQPLYPFTSLTYGLLYIADHPTWGFLTNILRFSLTGSGDTTPGATLGVGIACTVTQNDTYSFENNGLPGYEGPAEATSGGKTWWLDGISGTGENWQTFNVIGQHFFDENDVLHQVRLVADIYTENSAGDPGRARDYTFSLVIDDTVVGTYNRYTEDRVFDGNAYDGIDQWYVNGRFDRCGDTGVYGLLVTDPWHPDLPAGYTKEEGGLMATYLIGTPDAAQWVQVYRQWSGNAYPWPSYADHAAWHPVDKVLTWYAPTTWEAPCYV